ncbi:MAG: hypothetical protein ACKVHE_05645 [Planctomycetales bacterium]
MAQNTRRTFLSNVGRGMLAGSLGTTLATDLGLSPLRAEEDTNAATPRDLEPLISMMQETPLPQLQRVLVNKINSGTDLKSLIAAGTLANARTFRGHDYIGFHTFMALALDMSERLPTELKALPILKVLYRNTERIHAMGGAPKTAPPPTGKPDPNANGLALREATRAGDQRKAEQIFAAMSGQPRGEIFNHVQYAVQDSTNVHRVVLAWRAWLAVDLVGEQHAQSLLSQSVRFCTDSSQKRLKRKRPEPQMWTTLPAVLDQYKLLDKAPGDRQADDQWVEYLAFTILTGNPESATDAVAQALAEGFQQDTVAEAIALSANLQLLHDPGRPKASSGDMVIGSVHGDSVGVHASDAANAWRNIARVSNHRNSVVSLLLAAHNSAGMRNGMTRERWPLKDDQAERLTSQDKVLAMIDRAVRSKDQALAGAAVKRYHDLGGNSKPVFDLMLGFATSEDGAQHAEKFYRTVTEEFATTRKSLRWRQLVGLARVSASEYGRKSPGYQEACELLNVRNRTS